MPESYTVLTIKPNLCRFPYPSPRLSNSVFYLKCGNVDNINTVTLVFSCRLNIIFNFGCQKLGLYSEIGFLEEALKLFDRYDGIVCLKKTKSSQLEWINFF